MTAALAFLKSRWGFAAIGAALLVLVYSAWSIQVADLRGDISAEQQKTRDVQAAFDSYKLQVEQTISNNARQHAAELQKLLDEREALAATADRLRQQYAQEKENRTIIEAEHVRILNNAPRDQDSLLDARTRDYYRSLRERQLGTEAANNPPPR